jgi:hypothetical protein
MALAASVLTAFAAGWLIPRALQQDGESPSGPLIAGPGNSSERFVNATDPQWPDILDPNQVMSLVVTQPDGTQRPVLVPLLDADDANRLAGGITEAGMSSALPQSVRRQLEQAGYRIEQSRRYAPLPIDSGRRLLVPIEDTQIVPVRAGVY